MFVFLWKNLADHIEGIMVIYIFICVTDTSCVLELAQLILFAHPHLLPHCFYKAWGDLFCAGRVWWDENKYFNILLCHFNILDLEISNSDYINLTLAHSAIIRIICSNFVVHTSLIIVSSFCLYYTGFAFFSLMLFSFSNNLLLLSSPWVIWKCCVNN